MITLQLYTIDCCEFYAIDGYAKLLLFIIQHQLVALFVIEYSNTGLGNCSFYSPLESGFSGLVSKYMRQYF